MLFAALIIHQLRHSLKDKYTLLDNLEALCLIFDGIKNILDDIRYFRVDLSNESYIYNKYMWKEEKRSIVFPLFLQEFSSVGILDFQKIITYSKIAYYVLTCAMRDKSVFIAALDEDPSQIYDLRKMSEIEKWHKKCQIFDYVKYETLNNKEIAELLHVDQHTVAAVRNKYKENHFLRYEDLMEKQHGPNPNPFKKITESAFRDLENAMKKPTKEFNLPYPCWSNDAIRLYLKNVHNIDVSKEYLYNFLERIGFTSKAGKRSNPKKDQIVHEHRV